MYFRVTGRKVTKLQFHCFHLHDRVGSINFLLFGERLFQEYLCITFASIENQRLQFARYNQEILRSELYGSLQDAVSNDHESRVGKRVICPKSVQNSFRNRFCRC